MGLQGRKLLEIVVAVGDLVVVLLLERPRLAERILEHVLYFLLLFLCRMAARLKLLDLLQEATAI